MINAEVVGLEVQRAHLRVSCLEREYLLRVSDRNLSRDRFTPASRLLKTGQQGQHLSRFRHNVRLLHAPYSYCLAAFAWRLADTEDSHAHAVHVKKAARRNRAAGCERCWSGTAR
jgi:hypothetical protein